MPRRREVPKREILPDPKFANVEISKFINVLMSSGKKSVAERILYGAFDVIKTKAGKDPLEVFTAAIQNVKPIVEVKSRRVGGANYQVPTQVNSKRQQALAIRWLLEACREKKGRPMHARLAEEVMAAYRREGAAMTKRENVHRMADANKAFAHFAW